MGCRTTFVSEAFVTKWISQEFRDKNQARLNIPADFGAISTKDEYKVYDLDWLTTIRDAIFKGPVEVPATGILLTLLHECGAVTLLHMKPE